VNQNMTGRLADVIRAWAKGKPMYAAVPSNSELAADLDFVTTETAWTIARNRLVDQGVIGRDGRHYYVCQADDCEP
jgi:hypothetical protein